MKERKPTKKVALSVDYIDLSFGGISVLNDISLKEETLVGLALYTHKRHVPAAFGAFQYNILSGAEHARLRQL